MKFVQRDMGAAAEVSSAQNRQGREFVSLMLWALGLLVGLYLVAGLVADGLVASISVETERKIFDGNSWRGGSLLGPPATGDHATRLDHVLQRLVAHPEVPAYNYTISVTTNPAPNAFALPGGHLVFTTGLLDALPDDIGLAMVMAHEIGHMKNRDHLRGLGRQITFAIAWGVITGGSIQGVGIQTGSNLMERSYSRAAEHAADTFGLQLVHDQFGTTAGALQFFEYLIAQKQTPAFQAILSTHPATEERLVRLRKQRTELSKDVGAPD